MILVWKSQENLLILSIVTCWHHPLNQTLHQTEPEGIKKNAILMELCHPTHRDWHGQCHIAMH